MYHLWVFSFIFGQKKATEKITFLLSVLFLIVRDKSKKVYLSMYLALNDKCDLPIVACVNGNGPYITTYTKTYLKKDICHGYILITEQFMLVLHNICLSRTEELTILEKYAYLSPDVAVLWSNIRPRLSISSPIGWLFSTTSIVLRLLNSDLDLP